MATAAVSAGKRDLEQVPASGKVFACNICYEAVTEPVVTQCGHLYCWPCLYQWLEPGLLTGERHHLTGYLEETMRAVDESHRHCPACRLPVSVTTIVPIYAIVENENDVKEKPVAVKDEDGVAELQPGPKSLDSSSTADPAPTASVAATASTASATNEGGEEQQSEPLESSVLVEAVPDDEEEEEEEEDRKPAAIPLDRLHQEDEEENLTAMAYTVASQEVDDPPRVPFAAMPNEEEEEEEPTIDAPTPDTGLRQRGVPRRPAAIVPATRTVEESNVLTRPDIGRYPAVTPRSASIGQVLLLTLQQMLVRLDQSQRDQQQQTRSSGVPPLHETNRRNNYYNMQPQQHPMVERDETTEFLSRVLLMLGSFVILCLLLF